MGRIGTVCPERSHVNSHVQVIAKPGRDPTLAASRLFVSSFSALKEQKVPGAHDAISCSAIFPDGDAKPLMDSTTYPALKPRSSVP